MNESLIVLLAVVPYEGAKPMKLIDTEDRDLLAEMVAVMYYDHRNINREKLMGYNTKQEL